MEPARRVLLVVGGGVAAYKACGLARELGRAGCRVRAVLTRAATEFVTPLSFEALTGEPAFHALFTPRLGPMEHIELARWAELMVVAPATADLMARLAHGLADDLATTTALAFTGPVLVAPAMNPAMWAHPATRANAGVLAGRGVVLAGPAAGETACGEEGPGRMLEPEDLAARALGLLARAGAAGPLAGRRVLITTGPTREFLDPARFLSNPSTGRMGFRLAEAFRAAGARVALVRGPTGLAPPPVDEDVPVVSAADMHAAVMARFAGSDVFVAAAAVADWTPRVRSDVKEAKSPGPLAVELVRTRDILADCGAARRPDQVLVGFAAETDGVIAKGDAKRVRKRCDLLVANRIGAEGTGFGGERDEAAVLGEGEALPAGLGVWTKEELAREVVRRVAALLAGRAGAPAV